MRNINIGLFFVGLGLFFWISTGCSVHPGDDGVRLSTGLSDNSGGITPQNVTLEVKGNLPGGKKFGKIASVIRPEILSQINNATSPVVAYISWQDTSAVSHLEKITSCLQTSDGTGFSFSFPLNFNANYSQFRIEVFPQNYIRTGGTSSDSKRILFEDIVTESQIASFAAKSTITASDKLIFPLELSFLNTAKAIAYEKFSEKHPTTATQPFPVDFDVFLKYSSSVDRHIWELGSKMEKFWSGFDFSQFNTATGTSLESISEADLTSMGSSVELVIIPETELFPTWPGSPIPIIPASGTIPATGTNQNTTGINFSVNIQFPFQFAVGGDAPLHCYIVSKGNFPGLQAATSETTVAEVTTMPIATSRFAISLESTQNPANQYCFEVYPMNYKRSGNLAEDKKFVVAKDYVSSGEIQGKGVTSGSVIKYSFEINASDTAKALAFDAWASSIGGTNSTMNDYLSGEKISDPEVLTVGEISLAGKITSKLAQLNPDTLTLANPLEVMDQEILTLAQQVGEGIQGQTVDTTRPSVVSVLPAAQATDQSLNPSISITFSEIMKADTISSSVFYLSDESGNNVPGTISMVGTTATFTPGVALSNGKTYTVFLSALATDLAGNALLQAYSWSFSTSILQITGIVPTGFSTLGFPVTGLNLSVPNFSGKTAGLIIVNHGVSTFSGNVSAQNSGVLPKIQSLHLASMRVSDAYIQLTSEQAFQKMLRERELSLPPIQDSATRKPVNARILAAVVGDSIGLSYFDAADDRASVTATIKKIVPIVNLDGTTSNAVFCVDNSISSDTTGYVDNLGAVWPILYKKDREVFGNEPPAGSFNGLNLSEDITILILDSSKVGPGLSGYFWGGDLYQASTVSSSNERKMFTLIFYNPASPSLMDEKGTLAHEFQHMIFFYQRKKRGITINDTWLNEAFAGYAEEATGYGNPQTSWSKATQVKYYLTNIATAPLDTWLGDSRDYGKAALFSTWLAQAYATKGNFQSILADSTYGTSAVAGFAGVPWKTVVSNFAASLYANDYTIGGTTGISGFDLKRTFNYSDGTSVSLPGVKLNLVNSYQNTTALSIAPNSAGYIEYSGGSGQPLVLTLPNGPEIFELHK